MNFLKFLKIVILNFLEIMVTVLFNIKTGFTLNNLNTMKGTMGSHEGNSPAGVKSRVCGTGMTTNYEYKKSKET